MRFRGILIILIIPAYISFGQSLEITKYDSLVTGDAFHSNAIFAHASVKNLTDQAVEVLVKRANYENNSLTDYNSICWGVCYLPNVSVSTQPVIIAPGGTDSTSFSSYVIPDHDGIPQSGTIDYVFFLADQEQDSVSITIEFSVEVYTGINQRIENNDFLLYPNPTSGKLNINNKGQEDKFFIKIFDLSGKTVFHEFLENSYNTGNIDISHLNAGIYSYIIFSDNGILQNEKLIISK